ncbi:MAG: SIS domain-containing protein [Candidatus Saccharimonadales bacterium]
MLDDLKYIHHRDSLDALGVAERQWQQLLLEFDTTNYKLKTTNIQNVVYAGMGGSALAAELSKIWPGCNVPFEIWRQYQLPGYVSKNTLVICASYSGNTEEALSALAEAQERGAQIAIICGGGQLQKIAEEQSLPMLLLPKIAQPRWGVLANFKALLAILVAAGLIDKEAQNQVQLAADFLKKEVGAWLPTVATKENPAKSLAHELAGKSPVIYSGPLLFPAAYKWKINFNENAKNIAWCGQLPEFNHNEFIGWSSHPIQKPYEVIDLRSSFEDQQISKRLVLSDRLLSGKRPAAHVVEAKGDSLLEQLVWAVAYGDFVSIYLALLNGVDPGPVALVEKFKTELTK